MYALHDIKLQSLNVVFKQPCSGESILHCMVHWDSPLGFSSQWRIDNHGSWGQLLTACSNATEVAHMGSFQLQSTTGNN